MAIALDRGREVVIDYKLEAFNMYTAGTDIGTYKCIHLTLYVHVQGVKIMTDIVYVCILTALKSARTFSLCD